MKLTPDDLDLLEPAAWASYVDADDAALEAKRLLRTFESGVAVPALLTPDEFEGVDPARTVYSVERTGEWSIVARVPNLEESFAWLVPEGEADRSVSGVLADVSHAHGTAPQPWEASAIQCFVDCLHVRNEHPLGTETGLVFLHDPLLEGVRRGQPLLPTSLTEVTVDGRHVGGHARHAVHTVAFMAAAASEYLAAGSSAAPFRALLPCDGEPLLAVARARALRIVLGHIFDAFGIDRGALEIWGFVGGTLPSPHRATHQIRLTLGCAAAILGSCDRVVAEPYRDGDAHDVNSLRLAVNVPRILRFESHLGVVDDAMRGSYYVETLTGQLIEASWAAFLSIETAGGLLEAATAGLLPGLFDEPAGR